MMDTVFNFCAEMLWALADETGMTYKEINVWIFCIIWPALTIFLLVNNIILRKKIGKIESASEDEK